LSTDNPGLPGLAVDGGAAEDGAEPVGRPFGKSTMERVPVVMA
jgi:hypothetical protein